MAEYFLRILDSKAITKRMEADDDDTAIKAAIRWESKNPDMDLTCGLRRVAVRRKSVWFLRPDVACMVDQESARQAVDDFIMAAGWTGQAPSRGRERTEGRRSQAEQSPVMSSGPVLQRLLELLQRLK